VRWAGALDRSDTLVIFAADVKRCSARRICELIRQGRPALRHPRVCCPHVGFRLRTVAALRTRQDVFRQGAELVMREIARAQNAAVNDGAEVCAKRIEIRRGRAGPALRRIGRRWTRSDICRHSKPLVTVFETRTSSGAPCSSLEENSMPSASRANQPIQRLLSVIWTSEPRPQTIFWLDRRPMRRADRLGTAADRKIRKQRRRHVAELHAE